MLADWVAGNAPEQSTSLAEQQAIGQPHKPTVMLLHDRDFTGRTGALLMPHAAAIAMAGHPVIVASWHLDSHKLDDRLRGWIASGLPIEMLPIGRDNRLAASPDIKTADLLFAARRAGASVIIACGDDWSPLPDDIPARLSALGQPLLRWSPDAVIAGSNAPHGAGEAPGFVVDDCFFRPFPKAAARRAMNLPEEATAVALTMLPPDGNTDIARELRIRIKSEAQAPLIVSGIGSLMLGGVHPLENLSAGWRLCAYTAADVYVSPHRDSRIDAALLEAMACGIPVVTGPGPAATLLRENTAGIVAESASPAALARATLDLLRDKSRIAVASRVAREIIATQHSLQSGAQHWNRMLAQFSSAADAVIKDRPRP